MPDNLVCFDHNGSRYSVPRHCWDAVIELAYYDALPLANVPYNKPFLRQLLNDYSPSSFRHYKKVIARYNRVFPTSNRVDRQIPKPAFDFSTAVLELFHWYNCRLKPAVSKILATLDLSMDELDAFERHRQLEECMLRASSGRDQGSPDIDLEYIDDYIGGGGEIDSGDIGVGDSGDNIDNIGDYVGDYNGDYIDGDINDIDDIDTNIDGDIDNTTRILHHLNSSGFDLALISPILLTLSKSPRHLFLKLSHQCSSSLISSIQACLPPLQNDPSHLFAHIKSPSNSLASLLSQLSDAFDVIEWNYPLPPPYYYQIDAGLLPHPKLGVPVTSPQKHSLLDTFRFHHNLLIKQLELAARTDCGGYANYYKQLFYVFDAVPGLSKTQARHRIRDLVWNADFSTAARNQLHAFIVEELAEADRKESESGSVKGENRNVNGERGNIKSENGKTEKLNNETRKTEKLQSDPGKTEKPKGKTEKRKHRHRHKNKHRPSLLSSLDLQLVSLRNQKEWHSDDEWEQDGEDYTSGGDTR